MRLTTTLAASAAIAVAGVSANAGGLEVVADSAPIEVIPMMEKPTTMGGSIPAGYIVLGLVAALVAASASF